LLLRIADLAVLVSRWRAVDIARAGQRVRFQLAQLGVGRFVD
jgi:hypothetical protein